MSTPPRETKAERKARARAEREEKERTEAQAAARKRRLQQLGGVLVVALAIVAVLVAISSSGGDDEPERLAGETVAGETEVAQRFQGIPQDGLSLGDPDAPATLVEFADMQCPFCADFATDGLPGIIDEVQAGQARLEFEPLTFIGPDSERMARVIVAAGLQDRAWQVMDLLFINQGQENAGFATDEFLREILGAVDGLDVEQVLEDRDSPAVDEALQDAQVRAARFSIQSTPSFLVGPTGGELQRLEVDQLGSTPFENAIREVASR